MLCNTSEYKIKGQGASFPNALKFPCPRATGLCTLWALEVSTCPVLLAAGLRWFVIISGLTPRFSRLVAPCGARPKIRVVGPCRSGGPPQTKGVHLCEAAHLEFSPSPPTNGCRSRRSRRLSGMVGLAGPLHVPLLLSACCAYSADHCRFLLFISSVFELVPFVTSMPSCVSTPCLRPGSAPLALLSPFRIHEPSSPLFTRWVGG